MPKPSSDKFIKLPFNLLRRRGLSSSAKLLLGVMQYYASFVTSKPISLRTLAEDAGLHRVRAREAFQELVSKGMIYAQRVPGQRRWSYDFSSGLMEMAPTGGPNVAPTGSPRLDPTGGPRFGPPGGPQDGPHGGSTSERALELKKSEEGFALAPVTLQAAEEIRRGTGRPLSTRQMAHLNHAIVLGVPKGLMVDLAGTWKPTESPWDFAGRCLQRWERVREAATALYNYRRAGMAPELPAEAVESVKRYGSPAMLQAAFGESVTGAAPSSS